MRRQIGMKDDMMKRAVYEEMVKAMRGILPADVRAVIKAAEKKRDTAAVLPFYMYYFYPYKWQEYSLHGESTLPAVLNHATFIALDYPFMESDPRIKRFFYGASHYTPLPEEDNPSMQLEEWTILIYRKYCDLVKRAGYIEKKLAGSNISSLAHKREERNEQMQRKAQL
jgi:hypothetical protein